MICDDMVAFAEGRLDAEHTAAYREHLKSCETCSVGLAVYYATNTFEPDPKWQEDVWRHIAAARPAVLTPRAAAVLVSLRAGGRTTAALRVSISDPTTSATLDVLEALRDLTFVVYDRGLWLLAPAGTEWLRRNGVLVWG